jgi:hypothetical protein
VGREDVTDAVVHVHIADGAGDALGDIEEFLVIACADRDALWQGEILRPRIISAGEGWQLIRYDLC